MGEVVQASDAAHHGVGAVAFQSAVAKGLPGFHPGEGALDADTDLMVGDILLFLPGGQFVLPVCATVGNDQAGAPVAAVGDHRGAADGGQI